MLEVNISESTITSLINQIKNELNKSGIYYRLFYRIKDSNSINEKLKRKSSCKDYKMQDLVGVRIVLYFLDDIQICDTILKNIYHIDYANCNILQYQIKIHLKQWYIIMCAIYQKIQ